MMYKASKMCYQVKNTIIDKKEIDIKTVIEICETRIYSLPTVTYGAEAGHDSKTRNVG